MTKCDSSKDPRQEAYENHRRAHREAWMRELVEDFCARKEVDPENGRPLFDEPELR